MFNAVLLGLEVGWELWELIDGFLDPEGEIPLFG